MRPLSKRTRNSSRNEGALPEFGSKRPREGSIWEAEEEPELKRAKLASLEGAAAVAAEDIQPAPVEEVSEEDAMFGDDEQQRELRTYLAPKQPLGKHSAGSAERQRQVDDTVRIYNVLKADMEGKNRIMHDEKRVFYTAQVSWR